MTQDTSTLAPPIPDNDRGEPRRVGVEIELTELHVPEVAEIVAEVTGGSVRVLTDYEAVVEGSAHGDYRIEADLELLRRLGQKRSQEDAGERSVASTFRHLVSSAAELIAPVEVVTPPLPIGELPAMDELVARLGERGGRGTYAGPLAALGLQLNPEVPRTSAASIFAHLQAFIILAGWLRHRRGVDLSRRITPYVDAHPETYVRMMLARREPPTLAGLIDDYLRYSPTRNRDLDMLPLFAHLDEARVQRVVDDPRLKSRPTFHYRLPDSRVGDPDWRVTDEWLHWLVVERLATDDVLRRTLADTYLGILIRPATETITSMSSVASAWLERCEEMLAEAGYAP